MLRRVITTALGTDLITDLMGKSINSSVAPSAVAVTATRRSTTQSCGKTANKPMTYEKHSKYLPSPSQIALFHLGYAAGDKPHHDKNASRAIRPLADG
eukprot:scaffold1629_cov369-Prasinococcus_capsulatus_cf.AAC.26